MGSRWVPALGWRSPGFLFQQDVILISCHVDELWRNRGYRSRKAFAEAAGLTPWVLGRLARNRHRAVHFQTIERICTLLNCQPGDLFTHHGEPT